ncbi:MAG: transcriptional repressor [Mycobacterium sp.]|jgi:Fur family ferric uptake transcriptional regulator|nr:transcriptional repressor [Mycobacterium sp.]
MTDRILVEALRARGLRLTAQRQLVLDAVRRLGHATPEEIHAAVAETVSGVNITTVYRTLDLLEDLRLVTHTHLTHGPPTYHSADDDRHVHLVCRECQGVTEVEPALFDEVAARVLTEYGFGADVEHLALFGLCRSCAGASPDPTPR